MSVTKFERPAPENSFFVTLLTDKLSIPDFCDMDRFEEIMTCQSVSFSDITIRSEGNLTFTETLDISAGDKNTHNVYTFEFASYLPKSLLQKGTQVSSESTSISTATDETTFSWGECTLIYPDLSSYSLASPGTGGFF